MPRGDGTGPIGSGAMSGRGAGYCSGADAPGFSDFFKRGGLGRSCGRGLRGRGRSNLAFGRRHRAFFSREAQLEADTQGAADEMRALKRQVETLQARLDTINKRFAALSPQGD